MLERMGMTRRSRGLHVCGGSRSGRGGQQTETCKKLINVEKKAHLEEKIAPSSVHFAQQTAVEIMKSAPD